MQWAQPQRAQPQEGQLKQAEAAMVGQQHSGQKPAPRRPGAGAGEIGLAGEMLSRLDTGMVVSRLRAAAEGRIKGVMVTIRCLFVYPKISRIKR